MQFLYPAYLFGLSLIAIPIIIHLFKLRRYKTVYFSSLKFLKDAQASHKNKSRLKDILLLIIRILMIIALVLAFAQPYQGSGLEYKRQSSGVVSLYVDASHSMENQSDESNIFDQAKVRAIETVKKYPLETAFMVIDQSDPASYFTYVDRSEAIDKISSLSISHKPTAFSNIISQLLNYSNEKSAGKKFTSLQIFSDFQRSFFDIQNFSDSTSIPISLHPIIAENLNNIYIDTCWLEQPIHHFGSRISISGRIFNSGTQNYQQFPLILMVNDSLAARTSIELPAETSRFFSISYLPEQNGDQKVELKLNDYPVDFDNSFFLTFKINNKTNICHLYTDVPNQYLSSAMNSDSAFAYSEYPLTAFPENDFSMYQTVIITGLNDFESLSGINIESFVENGGNLIIFPDSTSNMAEINKISEIFNAPRLVKLYSEKEVMRFSPVMKDFHADVSLNPESTLNWPQVSKYFSMSRIGRSSQVLLEGNSKRPFMLSTRVRNGIYALSTVPLDSESTSIGEHPLFIPLLYFLTTAESRQAVIYSRIGSQEAFPLSIPPNFEKQIEISDPRSEFKTIPQQEAHPDNPVISLFLNEFQGPAGMITAALGNGETISIAMNYQRNESVLKYFSETELFELIDNPESNISISYQDNEKNKSELGENSSITSAVSLTRVLLLFALAMVVCETLLFRIKT